MALIRWEPQTRALDPFHSLRDEVDRLFDDFFRGSQPLLRGGWPGLAGDETKVPSVDLKETDDAFVLTAELPGVGKDELDLTVAEDRVTLSGERRREDEKKGENYHYRETTYGRFQRVVPLPDRILADKADARLKDGVLTLTLPKAEPAKTREVKVEIQ